MKAISTFLQLVLSIFGLAIIVVFVAKPSFYSAGYLLFGLGLIAVLWWIAIKLYIQAAPNTYLPKVVIYSGVLLSGISFYHLLVAYAGQEISLSLVKIICGIIGGFAIMRIGMHHQALNKSRNPTASPPVR